MHLCIWHRAGFKPTIQYFRNPLHISTAFTSQNNFVYEWSMQIKFIISIVWNRSKMNHLYFRIFYKWNSRFSQFQRLFRKHSICAGEHKKNRGIMRNYQNIFPLLLLVNIVQKLSHSFFDIGIGLSALRSPRKFFYFVFK